MASVNGKGGGKMSFETAARSISWLEKGRNGDNKNFRRRSSKDITIEMSALAEEAMNRDPHDLIREGEFEMLKALFEESTLSVKHTDSNGSSLLHTAASLNQTEIMRFLIENNALLNAVDYDGNTPLHVATIALSFDAIHFLLDKTADDTILNNNEDAPLHVATRMGNVELVKVFLQHQTIDLVVQGYRKRTPLHIAAELDLVDIVDAFSNAIVVVREWKEKASFRLCAADSDNLTPIHFAARCGSANCLRYMMSNCTKHGYPKEVVLKFIDEENSTPMHIAIDSGHLNVLQVLLEFGASPVVQNGDQIPPLHLACYQGRYEMVKLIVEHCGTEVIHMCSKNGLVPLHWGSHSIQGGKILQYLISKGANLSSVDNQGQTALHHSIIFGSLEGAKELIKFDDSSINITDKNGRNIFHHAVLHNRTAIMHVLLKLPNTPNLVLQQDKSGHCSIHYALENNQEELMVSLIAAVQTKLCNLKNEKGFNYLHIAAGRGNWKALSVLLDNPTAATMINEVDNEGSTPLHRAAIQGHVRCIELLLAHGAMIHRCYCGYTPFLAAVQYGNKNCAKTLFQAHPFQREWTDDAGNTALHLAVHSGQPNVLKLCLDLNIPLNRNENGESFFDMIIDKNYDSLAALVIAHDRWQECLDFPTLEGQEHPFLKLIKNCPDVARNVLNRCHEKCFLPQNHPDYYESYDFKYLRLDKDDIEHENLQEKQEKKDETMDDMMSEVSVKVRRNRATDIGNAVIGGTNDQPLLALTTMLYSNRVILLTHPVVIQYLKAKWRGYGRFVYCFQVFAFFIQIILLSTFVGITPPARLDIDDNTFEPISENITLSQVSVASNVVRLATLFVCLYNTIILGLNLFSIGLRVINITKYEVMWMLTLCASTTFAFLIPWKYPIYGFKFIYWEAGALATFSSWFSLVLLMKPFDFFGVYVTMFTEVLTTLIKVIFICVLFLLAFTFPFYIVAGDTHPFTNIGDSLFIMFSYILGEINYEYYVRRAEYDSFQHPKLTYLFVVVAAGILSVAGANFLIGLAVGDIDTIRRNAVIKQRSDEVRIFSRMDGWLPKCLVQKYNMRFHTVYFNKQVFIARKAWRYLWRAIKETQEEDKDVYKLLAEQQCQLNEVKQELSNQADVHKQRYDELKHLLQNLSSRLNATRDD